MIQKNLRFPQRLRLVAGAVSARHPVLPSTYGVTRGDHAGGPEKAESPGRRVLQAAASSLPVCPGRGRAAASPGRGWPGPLRVVERPSDRGQAPPRGKSRLSKVSVALDVK